MDKTKAPPIPDKTTAKPSKEPVKRSDPEFVRGTIDPTVKKGR